MALDTFGKRVRLLRQDRGLSQIELRDALQAVGVEIGESYISELERTDKMPLLSVAVGMAKVLDVSLDYLGMLTHEAKSYKAEPEIKYITPEAEEVAQIVDTLPLEQRTMILQGVMGIASPLSEQRRMRSSIRATLESVERSEGVGARREMERRLKEIGLRWDDR